MSLTPPEDPGAERDGFDLPPLGTDVKVPDDLSGWEHEVLAVQRERRLAQRQDRYRRLLFSRRWASNGISGPLVVAVLLLVGLVGSLLVLLGPVRGYGRAGQAVELAAPGAPDANPGGLLPAGTVREGPGGRRLDLRAIRPAALLVVPPDCGCAAAVKQLATATFAEGLQLALVGEPGATADLAELSVPSVTGSAAPRTVVDDAGLLGGVRAPGGGGPTVILVAPDGLIDSVVTISPGVSLTAALHRVTQPR